MQEEKRLFRRQEFAGMRKRCVCLDKELKRHPDNDNGATIQARKETSGYRALGPVDRKIGAEKILDHVFSEQVAKRIALR